MGRAKIEYASGGPVNRDQLEAGEWYLTSTGRLRVALQDDAGSPVYVYDPVLGRRTFPTSYNIYRPVNVTIMVGD